MSEDKIKLGFPSARQKLRAQFPQDKRGDVLIKTATKSFKLQKAFLRLESGFFKKNLIPNMDTLEIPNKFNQNHVTNVLKCIYGFTVQISKSQMMDYYCLLRYLQVDSLIKLLKQDILLKIQTYDLFVVMQLAHAYDQQQLFQVCILQLERQNFQQLRYAKHQLLHCPNQLFNMIIKTHNRFRSNTGKGVQFVQIDQLIKQFSSEKKLSEQQMQELKFELIDKKSLSSQEYKQIFLDDLKGVKRIGYQSMIKTGPGLGWTSQTNSTILNPNKLSESIIHESRKVSQELSLEMENTFQKKRNDQLQAENTYLLGELKLLKDSTMSNRRNFQDIRQMVFQLQAELMEKNQHQRQQTIIIRDLEKMCNQLKQEVSSRGQTIRKLDQKVSQLEQQKGEDKSRRFIKPSVNNSNNSQEYSSSINPRQSYTVQSQIMPAHLLNQLARPQQQSAPRGGDFKKSKVKQSQLTVAGSMRAQKQQIDEQQLQQMYSSRLSFDVQPRSCPKIHLPRLANFITTQGFDKKNLKLLFRRQANSEHNFGKKQAIFNRNSLLVLITTQTKSIFGAFTAVELTKQSMEYIADPGAFLFSISNNQKFPIRKNNIQEALYLTADSLICFSNDLMIANDCINARSECEWPQAYQSGAVKRTSKWLTGQQGPFSIRIIQIYEVQAEAMTMDL